MNHACVKPMNEPCMC